MGTVVNPLTINEAFTESRRSIIGGSDLSDILGIGDYACPRKAWKSKRNEKATNPFLGNFATERGSQLEDLVADIYAQRTGRTIRRVPRKFLKGYLTHRCGKCGTQNDEKLTACKQCGAAVPVPYIGPLSDREIVNTEGIEADFVDQGKIVLDRSWGPGILSVKVPGLQVYSSIKFQRKLSPSWIVQLQTELAVWNRRWGSYIFFNPEKWEGIIFDVVYDPEIGKAAIDAAVKFQALIENGPAPKPLKEGSKPCLNCPYRNGDCHESEWVASSRDDGDVVFDDALAMLVLEIREAEGPLEEAEEKVKELKDKLRVVLQEKGYDKADTIGARIHYILKKGRETFQLAAFKSAFADDKDLMNKIGKFLNKGKDYRELRIVDRPVGDDGPQPLI